MAQTLAERFWAKTQVAESGCIEWTGAINRGGYGTVSIRGHAAFPCRVQRAHRVALYLATGEPPEGHVLHSCDNRRCVNPEHLRSGTRLDNMRDCVERGRHAGGGPVGSRNHNAKLTEAQATEIRALRGVQTQRELARRFGVSRTTIGLIHTGNAWRSAQ